MEGEIKRRVTSLVETEVQATTFLILHYKLLDAMLLEEQVLEPRLTPPPLMSYLMLISLFLGMAGVVGGFLDVNDAEVFQVLIQLLLVLEWMHTLAPLCRPLPVKVVRARRV